LFTNRDQTEVRVDAQCFDKNDLENCGFEPGNFIAVDPCPEIDDNGFFNSRHLDNKAGAAILLSVAKTIMQDKISMMWIVTCFLLSMRRLALVQLKYCTAI